MRFPAAGTSIVSSALCALLAWPSLAGAATAAAPGDRQVLLVAAADSYADLKKQLAWIGTQTDNPGLAAMFESLFMLATRGAGLAGLDVRRPLGIVVTGDGEDVGVHGFVPVKSLDKLLASLQGITGPVEKDGDAYRVTLPSGLPLTISEREGWAVITPTMADGRATPVAGDPAALLGAVAKEYTIGIEAFPSRMSDAVRRRLEEGLDLAAAESAARGQPMDPAALKALLGNLRQTESFAVGLAIDDASGAVFVENRSVGIPGSVSAAASAAAAKGTLTVGMPPAAKGERPAMRGYIAQAIPEEARDQFLAALDQSLPREADDPVTRTVSRLVYDMLAAALGAGGIDAALAVDTSQTTAERPVPAVTAGVRVKDGAQLEQRVKQLFGAGGGLAGVRATFDAGKAGDANLHRIAIDVADDALAERLGRSLELTLAVAPNYALVLAGADAAARATAAIAASGRPVADAVPVADLQAFAAPLLRYADMLAAEGPAAKAADAAGDAGGGVVALRVRPIDRGLATRLSIDSGVLKALAAMTSPERPVGPGGIPLPEVPPGFPLPVPLSR